MESDPNVANATVVSALPAAIPVLDAAHMKKGAEAQQKSVSEAEWEREREAAANLQCFAQQPPEEVEHAANGMSEEKYVEKSEENAWEADTGTGENTGAGDGEDEGLEEGEATSPVGRDPRKAGREWTEREYERDSRAVRSEYESSMAGKKRAREKDVEYRNNSRRERYEDDQHRYSDRIGGERDGGGDRYSHRERDDYDGRRSRRERGSRWSRNDHGNGEYYGEREYYESRGRDRDRSDYGDRYREESPYGGNEESKRQRKECYRCGGRNHIVMVCTSTERDACKNLSLPKCSRCDGRGHAPDNCPTVVNANPCYRCRQPGHFARNCPYDAPADPPPPQQHRSQSHSQQHSVGGMPDAATVAAQAYGFSSPAQLYAALGMANGYTAAAYGYPVPNPAAAAAAWGSYADYGSGGGRGGHGGGHGGASMSDGRFIDRGDRGDRGERSHRDGPHRRAPPAQIGRCFRCGEDGHWTRDCPMRPADADPSGCYKCGKPGHKSRECNACYRCGQDGHRAADCHRR